MGFRIVWLSLLCGSLTAQAGFRDEMARVLNFGLNRPSTVQRLRGDYDPMQIPSRREIQKVINALTDSIGTPSFSRDTRAGRINRDFLEFERDDFYLAPDLTASDVMDARTQKELQTRLMVYLARLPWIENRKALAIKLCKSVPGKLPVRSGGGGRGAWREDLDVLSLLVDMHQPDPVYTPIQKIWHKARRCSYTLLREMLDN